MADNLQGLKIFVIFFLSRSYPSNLSCHLDLRNSRQLWINGARIWFWRWWVRLHMSDGGRKATVVRHNGSVWTKTSRLDIEEEIKFYNSFFRVVWKVQQSLKRMSNVAYELITMKNYVLIQMRLMKINNSIFYRNSFLRGGKPHWLSNRRWTFPNKFS